MFTIKKEDERTESLVVLNLSLKFYRHKSLGKFFFYFLMVF